jgi:dTDP-4-amino-4,6-dideoxygalactose transaminase
MLGNYGAATKYEHELCGMNSRTDELQAGFLRIKLPLVDDDNERRRQIAIRYCRAISHPLVVTPQAPADPSAHVWHLFVVRTAHRASLIEHLGEADIETMIHYPKAIHRQRAYSGRFVRSEPLPVSEELQDQILSLPISPVMTDDQVEAVVTAINGWRGPQSPLARSTA